MNSVQKSTNTGYDFFQKFVSLINPAQRNIDTSVEKALDIFHELSGVQSQPENLILSKKFIQVMEVAAASLLFEHDGQNRRVYDNEWVTTKLNAPEFGLFDAISKGDSSFFLIQYGGFFQFKHKSDSISLIGHLRQLIPHRDEKTYQIDDKLDISYTFKGIPITTRTLDPKVELTSINITVPNTERALYTARHNRFQSDRYCEHMSRECCKGGCTGAILAGVAVQHASSAFSPGLTLAASCGCGTLVGLHLH